MRSPFIAVVCLLFLSSAHAVNVTSVAMPEYLQKPEIPQGIPLEQFGKDVAPRQQGKIEILRLADSKDLLKTIYSSSFVRFAQLQQQIPQGIVLTDGNITLERLSSELPNIVEKRSNGDFLARLPIIIDIGAELVINNSQRLLLARDKGVFIHNNGTLTVIGGSIFGWDLTTKTMSDYAGDVSLFRPFIIAFGGSVTRLKSASIGALGFDESSSYGFTVRTATPATLDRLSPRERQIVEKPPVVFVQDSQFSDMYVGLYMDGAVDSYVVDSDIADSIDTGILIANQSRNITLLRNAVSGTQNKHGIVVSTGAEKSVVMHNKVYLNERSGVLIDRLASPALIAFNDIHANGKDGISVYESFTPEIYGNRVYKNRSHGIRVRGSQAAKLHHNIILSNQGAGVYLHNAASNSDTEASAEVLGGLIVENASGAVYANDQTSLILGGLKIENNGAQEYRGDLTSKTGDIIVATWKDGTAALITEDNAQ